MALYLTDSTAPNGQKCLEFPQFVDCMMAEKRLSLMSALTVLRGRLNESSAPALLSVCESKEVRSTLRAPENSPSLKLEGSGNSARR